MADINAAGGGAGNTNNNNIMPAATGGRQPNLQDVALSLCALGRGSSSSSRDGSCEGDSRDDGMIMNPNTTTTTVRESSTGVYDPVVSTNTTTATNAAPLIGADMNRLKISDHVPTHVEPTSKKEVVAKKRGSSIKYNVKPKDPKRDTAIPFEEMQRLMRVYGSLKCLRNRTPKDSGKTVKLESIRRKFYRWFPDFEQRFEKTPEGWYQPKLGHEHEMRYREDMRKQDQLLLVKKRNSKRESKIVDTNLL